MSRVVIVGARYRWRAWRSVCNSIHALATNAVATVPISIETAMMAAIAALTANARCTGRIAMRAVPGTAMQADMNAIGTSRRRRCSSRWWRCRCV